MMILKLHKEHSHGNLIQLFSLIFHRISPLLIELLKKCSNTFTSLAFNFLAFISLKTWNKTNTLKNIE